MNTQSTILIRASRRAIYDSASDLSRWPAVLPHYRHIRYLQRDGHRSVVQMAAHRGGIPVSWVSEQINDPERLEIRFTHLRAFTKGMGVVWSFEEMPDGTLVRIVHVLRFRIPALAPIADRIIGGFFIEDIAHRTLRAFKAHLEFPASAQ